MKTALVCAIVTVMLLVASAATTSNSLNSKRTAGHREIQSIQNAFSAYSRHPQYRQNTTAPFRRLKTSKKLSEIDMDEIFANALKAQLGDLHIQLPGCEYCKSALKYLQGFLNTTMLIEDIADFFCGIIIEQEICDALMRDYLVIGLHQWVEYKMDPATACGVIHICPPVYETLDLTELATQILMDMPNKSPNKTGKAEPTPENSTSDNAPPKYIKIVQIADLHMDMEYEEGYNARCGELLCCRNTSGLPKKPDDRSGYWGALGKCDVPPRTVDQMFQFIEREIKPEIIVWTGDNVPHDVWMQNKSKQMEPTQVIADQISQRISNTTRIYPTLGNHECYPSDQYNFRNSETAWPNRDIADIWKRWLTPEEVDSVIENGTYSKYDDRFNLRILSVNSQFCDVLNFYLIGDPTDPKSMLEWLRKQLYFSERYSEQVLIIGHIPPGDYYCSSRWALIYSAIVERFQGIIIGQFFSHTHFDHFQLIPGFHTKLPAGVIHIAPSMTTFGELNPSFRVYLLDHRTKEIVNIQQYRLNLSKWNDTKTGPIDFDLAYDFLQEYNIPSMEFKHMQQLAANTSTNLTLRAQYAKNYFSGNKDLVTGSIEYKDDQFMCLLANSLHDGFTDCMGYESLIDPYHYVFGFLSMLEGDWRKVIKHNPRPRQAAAK